MSKFFQFSFVFVDSTNFLDEFSSNFNKIFFRRFSSKFSREKSEKFSRIVRRISLRCRIFNEEKKFQKFEKKRIEHFDFLEKFHFDSIEFSLWNRWFHSNRNHFVDWISSIRRSSGRKRRKTQRTNRSFSSTKTKRRTCFDCCWTKWNSCCRGLTCVVNSRIL